MSGDGEGVSVNGVLSGARTGTTNFTAYISPYLVLNKGGYYTKHIYIGSQRVVSKLGSSDIFKGDPPFEEATALGNNFYAKYYDLVAKIKTCYDSLGVVYSGTPSGAGIETSVAGMIPTPLQYFYHSDHLGSSSLITDASGALVQHLEYIPFGEVFIEERNSTCSTPYKFNGKELDEETGLYYYGARYMDPRTSVWISVDPLAEKYPNISSYVYCADNPVKYVDPDGRNPALAAGAIVVAGAEYLLIAAGVITYGNVLYLGPDGMMQIRDDVKAKLGALTVAMISIKLVEYQRMIDLAKKSKSNNSSKTTKEQSTATAAAPNNHPNQDNKENKQEDEKKSNDKNERKFNVNKSESPVWKRLKNAGNNLKESGRGRSKQSYQWDHTHNDIEVYDRNGNHMGSMNPETGKMYKPKVVGRTINK